MEGSFEDFRIKVSNVEKSTQGITLQQQQIEFGTRGFCSFVNV
jgi:hypothetical protein